MSKLIRAILIIAIGLFAQIANSAEGTSATVVKGTDQPKSPSNSTIDKIIKWMKRSALGEMTQLNIHEDNHFCYAQGEKELVLWRSEPQNGNTLLTLQKDTGETLIEESWPAQQQTLAIPSSEIKEETVYQLTVTADKSDAKISGKEITFHKLPNLQDNIDQLVEKSCIRQAVTLCKADPECNSRIQ